ncbi:MAG: hypothetical protein BGO92_04450 [Magnetospirillum sp. 64-120]|nr:MAG: hypothetical protein BGO92_04450 [Magnetospirillum sp. 64-120]
MAWVLPGSFLQADYAVGVRNYLAQSFASVLCVLMHQRFFKEEGTEEETVILLARDKKDDDSTTTIRFIDASSVDELKTIVDNWDSGASVGRPLDARPSFFVIEQCVATIFNQICERSDCRSLGDYLTTNIGLVTGANTFFVLSERDRENHGLGEADTQPVLGKFKAAKGASFSMADHASFMEIGGKGHLISTKELPPIGSALRKYLDSFPAEQRENISTFKKRLIWHAPADAKVPDAFLSVMNHDGPRLVLNEARIHCTNTIHRAFFSEGVDNVTRKLLVISLLTSFSQLSAEFVGRRYGSGVLKHEPREAERISILMPKKIDPAAIEKTFTEIDGLLRSGNIVQARAKADRLIIHKIKGGKGISAAFELALHLVRELRRTTRYASGA